MQYRLNANRQLLWEYWENSKFVNQKTILWAGVIEERIKSSSIKGRRGGDKGRPHFLQNNDSNWSWKHGDIYLVNLNLVYSLSDT